MITDRVDAKSKQFTSRILTEDNAFPNSIQEHDHSHLIQTWRAELNRADLKETLNLIHVRETKLIKRDLERGIKIIEENKNILGLSNGFQDIGKKIGIDSNSIFSARSDNKLTPVILGGGSLSKSQSYLELKHIREQEKQEKLKLIEENYEKIRALNQSRSERIQKLKAKAEKKAKKIEQKQESESDALSQWKEERNIKIKEMKDALKKQQEERIKQNRISNREIEKLKTGPLLYKSINEKFSLSIEAENLAKKKEALAQIRALHQPMDYKKIHEEQLLREELIKQQNEEKRKQLVEWQKQNEQSYDFKKFNNRYITRILEEDEDKRVEENEREEFKKSLHQKMLSYNDTIKRKYAPIVSRTKKEEVEKRKKSLEIPAREKYRPQNNILSDQDKKKKIYLERMEFYNKQTLNKNKTSSTPSISTKTEKIDYLKDLRPRNDSLENIRDRGKSIILNYIP